MADIIEQIKAVDLDSSFLRDILSPPDKVNPYNIIYNLEGTYDGDSVLITGLVHSDSRPVTTQIVKDISELVFEQLRSVVVKDTFPLGSGHILCVPMTSVPSFNQYLKERGIEPEEFNKTRRSMAEYIRAKAIASGLACDQVVLFEHGSGNLTEEGKVFNACGTGVELCSTAVHAHLHLLPVPNKRITRTDIENRLIEIAGEDGYEIIQAIQSLDHGSQDLGGATYFSLRIIDFAGGEDLDLLIVPDTKLFSKIPSQLWRRVLGPFVQLEGIDTDLVDYKRLSNLTLGDLRAEKIIKDLRIVHDNFWVNPES